MKKNIQAASLNSFKQEPNIDEKIKGIVTENLNKLYEIFLQYSFLYQQQSEKRDEICITIQDLMHFLKFVFKKKIKNKLGEIIRKKTQSIFISKFSIKFATTVKFYLNAWKVTMLRKD